MNKKIIIILAIAVFGWLIITTFRDLIANTITNFLIEKGITNPTTQAYSIIGISLLSLILIFYYTKTKFNLSQIIKKWLNEFR